VKKGHVEKGVTLLSELLLEFNQQEHSAVLALCEVEPRCIAVVLESHEWLSYSILSQKQKQEDIRACGVDGGSGCRCVDVHVYGGCGC